MGLHFQVRSAGGVASTVQLGPHTVLFDQPVALGGAARGPSPLVVFAAAVGACSHYYAAAFLTQRGLPVEGLTVDVDYEKASEGPERIANLVMQIQVPAATPAKYLAAIERAVRGCPAYGTLVQSPDVVLRVVRQAESAAATPEH